MQNEITTILMLPIIISPFQGSDFRHCMLFYNHTTPSGLRNTLPRSGDMIVDQKNSDNKHNPEGVK